MPLEPLCPVLRSEELPAGTPSYPGFRRVQAGAAEVLVARLGDGRVVAIDPTCPHQNTSLEDATLWDGYLRCPKHLYLYDLATGDNVLPSRQSRPENLWKLKPGYLPVHRVEELEGWIWVAEPAAPPPAGYDPERERPPSPGRAPVAADDEHDGSAGPLVPAGPVEHPPAHLQVNLGEEFELSLDTTPSPGHLWQVALAGPGLTLRSQHFEPGPPPAHRIRLWAGAPGAVTVRCTYATPWATAPREVRTFVVQVNPASGDPANLPTGGASGAG